MAQRAAATKAADGDKDGSNSRVNIPRQHQMHQPKNDKLAAMANSQSNKIGFENSPDKVVDAQHQQEGILDAAEATKRRDKMAALASRDNDSKNNTFDNNDANPKIDQEIVNEAAFEREKYLSSLKERVSNRKGILNSLDRAEELTCKLLKIAAKTTDALQDLNVPPSLLAELSAAYRSTLHELHPLLTIDTEKLILPYQNHAKEHKQSMYAARVEMRLAMERKEILEAFATLEKDDIMKQKSKDLLITVDNNVKCSANKTGRKRKI